MHHKRRRPKHQRAGCLLCKPWKDERGKNGKSQAERRRPGRRGLRKKLTKEEEREVDRQLGFPETR